MWYDGTKILSLKDIDGLTPEIYIVIGNRCGGKTTYFSRLILNKFIKKRKKFMLLYRYPDEIQDIDNKFFKTVSEFYPGWKMTSKNRSKGLYKDLYLGRSEGEEIHCGYAVPINASDKLRKFSQYFSDVDSMFFDEFLTESDEYCPNELIKFNSLHVSVARAFGTMNRRVPVYMVSNKIKLLNPYFTALGISERLTNETKFMRGPGWVLEMSHIEDAELALKESAFNRAFANTGYLEYAAESKYLSGNEAFVEKIKGKNKYLGTIKADGKEYGVRLYPGLGLIYCSKSVDSSCKNKLSLTKEDHDINYVMINANVLFRQQCRYLFEKGAFRFQDLECKSVIIRLLSA